MTKKNKQKRCSSQELFDRVKLEMIMKIHGVSKSEAKKRLTPPCKSLIGSADLRVELDEELISADEFLKKLN